MKRKTLSIILICLMVLNLSACGENTTSTVSDNVVTQTEAVAEQPAEKETDEAVEETKPEEEISEEAQEETEEAVTEEKPSEDTEAEPEASAAVETNPTNEVQDTGDTKTSPSSTDTVDTQQDVTAPDPRPTPDQQPAQDTTSTQADSATDTGSSFSTAGIGSTFDVNNYAYHVSGADVVYEIDHQVMIVYGSWFIEMSTNSYNANSAYISVGRWDTSATYWNVNTYSYVFAFGDGSRIIDEDSPGYSYNVSKTALAILPTLVDYMKNSGNPSVAPNIPGCTFKSCQSDNPFVQF